MPPKRRTAEIPLKVERAMNEQVRNEIMSWYQYLAMAAWLERARLPGAAKWMRFQAAEELTHAMRFYDFVVDRNGSVELKSIPEPARSFPSALAVMEAAYANEQDVTASIIALHELSVKERDYVSHAFIQDFLMEQVEEEKTASRLVDMFRMAGTEGPGLLLVDKDLGGRSGEKEGR